MAQKLNSMRVLEQAKVPYEALEYPDTIHDAQEVAEVLGLPYHIVYKTLVVQAEGVDKPMLVMIASDQRLDLKKVALASGHKKVRMAKHADAEALTGLKVGGISALALRDKNWPVFIDSSATQLEHIVISAGQRGTQLRVPVTPMITLLRLRMADVGIEDDGQDEA